MSVSKMLKNIPRNVLRGSAPSALVERRSLASRRQRLESEAEIAGYVGQLTAEMGNMAQAAHLDLLSYFLSLARMEAETAAARAKVELGALKGGVR